MALNDDLDLLDRQIRQLQVEWEKFFAGTERRPPNELQSKVEALVRKYAYAEMRNMTERFRYQSLTSRFTSFNEMWGKRLRAREEGHALGVHGLKAIMPPPLPEEAAAAFAASLGASAGTEAEAAPAPTPSRAAAAAAAAARAAAANQEVRVRSAEEAGVRRLFEQFAEARRSTGEPAVKFESFQKLIAQQAQRIMGEKGASAVDFRIETKDGKVGLKAKPVR